MRIERNRRIKKCRNYERLNSYADDIVYSLMMPSTTDDEELAEMLVNAFFLKSLINRYIMVTDSSKSILNGVTVRRLNIINKNRVKMKFNWNKDKISLQVYRITDEYSVEMHGYQSINLDTNNNEPEMEIELKQSFIKAKNLRL